MQEERKKQITVSSIDEEIFIYAPFSGLSREFLAQPLFSRNSYQPVNTVYKKYPRSTIHRMTYPRMEARKEGNNLT